MITDQLFPLCFAKGLRPRCELPWVVRAVPRVCVCLSAITATLPTPLDVVVFWHALLGPWCRLRSFWAWLGVLCLAPANVTGSCLLPSLAPRTTPTFTCLVMLFEGLFGKRCTCVASEADKVCEQEKLSSTRFCALFCLHRCGTCVSRHACNLQYLTHAFETTHAILYRSSYMLSREAAGHG